MYGVSVLFSGIEIFDDMSYFKLMLTDLGIRKNATGVAMHAQINSIITNFQNLEMYKICLYLGK